MKNNLINLQFEPTKIKTNYHNRIYYTRSNQLCMWAGHIHCCHNIKFGRSVIAVTTITLKLVAHVCANAKQNTFVSLAPTTQPHKNHQSCYAVQQQQTGTLTNQSIYIETTQNIYANSFIYWNTPYSRT